MMVHWALAIGIVAFLLAAARWAVDWWAGSLPWQQRGGRHERVNLRVELLSGRTNCFVIRGASSIIVLSLRLYTESEQREAEVRDVRADVRIGRQWRRLPIHENPDAEIFGSLARNALPLPLDASASEDVYEVYEWPELISRTSVRARVTAYDESGEKASVEDTLSLRLDSRPPLDVLFQTLDVR
jgi:hypothetical protein